MPDLSPHDFLGLQWMIDALEKSDRPVAIVVLGSATDVALIVRREPELLRKKCASIYLNAGAANPNPAKPEMLEYNVRVNPAAYAAIFHEPPCPLNWFSCWNMCEDWKSSEWGTFYWAPHKKVFEASNRRFLPIFGTCFLVRRTHGISGCSRRRRRKTSGTRFWKGDVPCGERRVFCAGRIDRLPIRKDRSS